MGGGSGGVSPGSGRVGRLPQIGMPAALRNRPSLFHDGIDYLFFAGFFAGEAGFVAAAGCALGSGILPTVMIWVWLLAAPLGRAGSSNCSSPNPTDCSRFDEILKVLIRMSRTASARRWLS